MSTRKIVQVSSKYVGKDGVERWRNAIVGSAWVRDNGEISIALDPGISIATNEGVRISIKDPIDRDAQRQQRAPTAKPGNNADDDIPF